MFGLFKTKEPTAIQVNLLATWKKNIDIIAEKRAKFYSIK